jgi:predicted RNase H-like HicB family nuclease
MILEYLQAAMHKAQYEFLLNDKLYYGDIPGFEGVYATAETLENCREQLQSVLEDWILISVHQNLPTPIVDALSLEIKKVA